MKTLKTKLCIISSRFHHLLAVSVFSCQAQHSLITTTAEAATATAIVVVHDNSWYSSLQLTRTMIVRSSLFVGFCISAVVKGHREILKREGDSYLRLVNRKEQWMRKTFLKVKKSMLTIVNHLWWLFTITSLGLDSLFLRYQRLS